MKKVKALLLAAGYGTRLRPLTLITPKCLIKVNGVPLLHYWLMKLEKLGCDEVIINTHYLSDQVIEFLGNYKSLKLSIITSHEKKILGTAGTLMKHIDFFKGSTGLLIHADNYTNEDLDVFLENHYLRPKDCSITMLTFDSEEPSLCGIVQKDKEGRIIDFHEKSENYYGNCANGALYAFDDDFTNNLKNLTYKIQDFSLDVIPKFLGHIFSWHTSNIYMDIGNESSLKKANIVASLNNSEKNIKK